MEDIKLVQKIAQLLYDKKARDIVALKVDQLTTVCEYMVIATGRSTVQVRSLADHVEEELKLLGLEPKAVETQREARWLILDYGFILVHVFHTEEREFYNLERLWNDGQNRIELELDQTAL